MLRQHLISAVHGNDHSPRGFSVNSSIHSRCSAENKGQPYPTALQIRGVSVKLNKYVTKIRVQTSYQPQRTPPNTPAIILPCIFQHPCLLGFLPRLEVFLFYHLLFSQKPGLIVFNTPIAHKVFILIHFSVQVNPSTLGTDSFHVQIKFSIRLLLNWSSHIRRLITHNISPLPLFLKLKYLSLVKIR